MKTLEDDFAEDVSYFQQIKNMMHMGQSTRFVELIAELDNKSLCRSLSKVAVEAGHQSHFSSLITREILNRMEK